jgi:hypothetical protein
MNRSLLLSSLVVVAALAAAGVSFGSASSRPSIHVQPGTVSAGGRVHVYGNAGACSAGSRLTAISTAFPGHAFGKGTLSGRVRSNGAFSFTGHLRGGVHAGSYSVAARCGGGNLGVSARVRVS